MNDDRDLREARARVRAALKMLEQPNKYRDLGCDPACDAEALLDSACQWLRGECKAVR